MIGLTERQWAGIVTQTGTADDMAALERKSGFSLREEGNRWSLRNEITAILKPWFAARRVPQFAADFDNAGLTWSEFRTLDEALSEDPDLSEDNPMFKMMSHSGVGRYPVPGSPTVFSTTERPAPVAPPILGQHAEEVLGDIAQLDDREISTLFERGIVHSPDWHRSRSAA